jgi:hypothetical protein
VKKIALLVTATILSVAPLAVAQDTPSTMLAYSATLDRYVNVNILKVEQTPMRDQDFCTLLTGHYC